MIYKTSCFKSDPDWADVPVAAIASWHWEEGEIYRPPSFAQLCAIGGEGLCARLWSFEPSPRATLTKRDDPVYEDSCLELFLQLDPHLSSYLNLEFNSAGVYRSQVGPSRNERTFISTLTDKEPHIKIIQIQDPHLPPAWGIEVFLQDDFISDACGFEFKSSPRFLRGNFYKCGDKTPVPHYGAFAPVGSALKGFHNPSHFCEINII